jgi:hypothetical protein
MDDFTFSRFSDVAKEKGQFFSPIDLSRQPLVTLEEACADLLPLVHNLAHYIGVSYMWVDSLRGNLPHGVSEEVAAAYNLYTREWERRSDSFYFILNEKLRSEDRHEIKPFLPYLRLMYEGQIHLPRSKIHSFWRGMQDSVNPNLYEKPNKLVWWGFSSCTTDMKPLENFLGVAQGPSYKGPKCLFNIHSSNAICLRDFSVYPTENEVLLFPGVYLEAKNQLTIGHITIIELQEIPPRVSLVILPQELQSALPKVQSVIIDPEEEARVIETLKKLEEDKKALEAENQQLYQTKLEQEKMLKEKEEQIAREQQLLLQAKQEQDRLMKEKEQQIAKEKQKLAKVKEQQEIMKEREKLMKEKEDQMTIERQEIEKQRQGHNLEREKWIKQQEEAEKKNQQGHITEKQALLIRAKDQPGEVAYIENEGLSEPERVST